MISMYAEKKWNISQNSIIILKKKKAFNELDTEETYLNIKKATEEKAHT